MQLYSKMHLFSLYKSSLYIRQLSLQCSKIYKEKNAEKSVIFESKVYFIDASSNNKNKEFAEISWKKYSEISIVLTAADTRYILYITD